MNEQFLMEATACRDARELRFVLSKFGLSEGRFLLNYPSSWNKLLFAHIETFPDIEQLKAKRMIERLKQVGGVLKSGAAYDSSRSWLSNALELKSGGGVCAAISRSHSDCLNPDDLEEYFDGDNRGERIEATANEIARVARPLLMQSEEVVLIDPYLSLGKRGYIQVLRQMLAEKSNLRMICFSKDEHFSCKEPPNIIAKREFLPFLGPRQSIQFVSLQDARDMHARYLLSIKGGIKYDKGFQESPGVIVDVETMSSRLHGDYWHIYMEGGHDFQVVDNFTINGMSAHG